MNTNTLKINRFKDMLINTNTIERHKELNKVMEKEREAYLAKGAFAIPDFLKGEE